MRCPLQSAPIHQVSPFTMPPIHQVLPSKCPHTSGSPYIKFPHHNILIHQVSPFTVPPYITGPPFITVVPSPSPLYSQSTNAVPTCNEDSSFFLSHSETEVSSQSQCQLSSSPCRSQPLLLLTGVAVQLLLSKERCISSQITSAPCPPSLNTVPSPFPGPDHEPLMHLGTLGTAQVCPFIKMALPSKNPHQTLIRAFNLPGQEMEDGTSVHTPS